VTGAATAGKPVELAFGCTDGTALSAITEARRLVEQVGVRILIGPSTPAEAIGLILYARRRPDVTFVDGTAGAQMLSPLANVFSFHPDLAASMAGLGTYAFRTLRWRRAVVVGELDDALASWTQAAGFTAEFCALGGTIARRVWVPRAAPSPDRAVAGVFAEGDGVFAAAGIETILALYRVHGQGHRIGGKLVTGVTPGGFDAGDPVVHAAPWRSTGNDGKAFASALRRRFPELTGPSAQADIAYHDAMSAVLAALSAAGGDMSRGAARFRSALRSTTVASPLGQLRVVAAGHSSGRSVVVRTPGDTVIRVVAGVEPTFGGYFVPGEVVPGPATPACRRHAPPRWAR
jgi:branched-chain amino acid transport system substrate-binding protein